MFARYAGYSAIDFKPELYFIMFLSFLVKLTDLMNLANILHSLTHEPRKAKDPTLKLRAQLYSACYTVIKITGKHFKLVYRLL